VECSKDDPLFKVYKYQYFPNDQKESNDHYMNYLLQENEKHNLASTAVIQPSIHDCSGTGYI